MSEKKRFQARKSKGSKPVDDDVDDGPGRLKAVLAKYRDRVKDKDEDAEQAALDWERFQGMSVGESRAMGGSESTTHLVKGLDVELLRKHQHHVPLQPTASVQSVIDSSPTPLQTVPPGQLEPHTEMGRAVWEVLFSESNPHPHNLGFSELIDSMPTSNSAAEAFFQSAKYVYTDASELPAVVMGVASEPRFPTVRVPHEPGLIQALAEAQKRKKHKKGSSKPTAVAADDDFDIFSTIDGVPAGRTELPAPIGPNSVLFEMKDQPNLEGGGVHGTELIQEALRKRQPVPGGRLDDDHEELTAFGEKLDVSTFQADVQKRPKRAAGGKSDKQLLNEVMKRVNQMR